MKHDGGPAFASEDTTQGTQSDGNRTVDPQDGMSLRAWLAGQALAGFCSTLTGNDLVMIGEVAFSALAKMSVRAADATLEILEAKGGA